MSNAVFLRPDENGNWGKVGADASGNMSSLLTFQSGATALGNGTAQDVSGYATLFVQVTISNTATVSFEGSLDGINFTTIGSNNSQGTGASVTSTNASGTGFFRFSIAGLKFFRTRISAYTSGTIDVTGYVSTATFSPLYLTGTYGNSDTNSASVTLQAVGAYNLLFDGTNWVRQRFAVDSMTAGVIASGSMVYDTTGSVFNKQLSALSAGDGHSGNKITTGALMAFNGTSWDRLRSVNTGQLRTTLYSSTGVEPALQGGFNDATPAATNVLATGSLQMGYNGLTWSRVRIGSTYKYIESLNLANATATTVWTPAAGKKIRIMAISISTGSNGNKFHLRTGTAGSGTAFYTFRSNGTAGDTQNFSFGNGFLATNANDVLEVYNVSGVTADVWVTAWGTEE